MHTVEATGEIDGEPFELWNVVGGASMVVYFPKRPGGANKVRFSGGDMVQSALELLDKKKGVKQDG
jgi:hypothetical protein